MLAKKLETYAIQNSLSYYIHITPTYNFLKFLHKDYKKSLNYSDYLKVISKSRCIVDFVQEGQSGTTMRTLEAIFSTKKIVSNNEYLKDMDFFHPNNIFIVKGGSFDGLKQFLESDYMPISSDILKTYTFDYWIKQITSIK